MTGTFVDYALPTAAELPSFETDRTETPSPVNQLGVKGVGEAGTIAATPAVVNAVIDALRPLGVTTSTCRSRRCACGRRSRRRRAQGDGPAGDRAGRRARRARQRLGRLRSDAPGREVRRDPRRVRLRGARRRSTRRSSCSAQGGEDAKLLAGGHSLLPLMKLRFAAPSMLVDLRNVAGAVGHRARRTATSRIGALTRHAELQSSDLGLRRRRRPSRSPTSRCATAARSAARSRTATRRPTCRRCCSRWTAASPRAGRTASATIAAGDLFQDYLTTALADDEVITDVRLPVARRLRLRVPEVHAPRRGLGDGRRGGAREGRRRHVLGRARRR